MKNHTEANLSIGHLPVIGAGEFDTSYAPIEFDDGQFHIKCVVNYGAFDVIKQYREGGILWIVTDTETGDELRLVGQEGDARLVMFVEGRGPGRWAHVEYALTEMTDLDIIRERLFGRLRDRIFRVQGVAVTSWDPLLKVAEHDIDLGATLRGLGYVIPSEGSDGDATNTSTTPDETA